MLDSVWPATTAGPRTPPRSNASRFRRSSPEVFAEPWHERQCSASTSCAAPLMSAPVCGYAARLTNKRAMTFPVMPRGELIRPWSGNARCVRPSSIAILTRVRLLAAITAKSPLTESHAARKACRVPVFSLNRPGQACAGHESRDTSIVWRAARGALWAGASSEVFTKHETRDTKHGFFSNHGFYAFSVAPMVLVGTEALQSFFFCPGLLGMSTRRRRGTVPCGSRIRASQAFTSRKPLILRPLRNTRPETRL